MGKKSRYEAYERHIKKIVTSEIAKRTTKKSITERLKEMKSKSKRGEA